MNFFSNSKLLFVLSCFIFVSCSKTKIEGSIGTNSTTNDSTTIYIAGNIGDEPVLWKNGTAEILSKTAGAAYQVTVSDTNVYVAGENGGQYVYWKNGIQNNIVSYYNGLSSISLIENNVYYSTFYSCWENGSMIKLPDQWVVYSTFAAGNDIYFVGDDSANDAVYWKNSILNVVARPPVPFSGSDPVAVDGPNADCIYVSGNDVYVGGNVFGGAAVYWKNGIADTLHSAIMGSGMVTINSIFVSANDVYVSGNVLAIEGPDLASNAPVYWKNGVEYDLPLNGATSGFTNSIFISGSDIYVAGETYSGTSLANAAVYWKNGVETVLPSSGNAYAAAYSIYVQ